MPTNNRSIKWEKFRVKYFKLQLKLQSKCNKLWLPALDFKVKEEIAGPRYHLKFGWKKKAKHNLLAQLSFFSLFFFNQFLICWILGLAPRNRKIYHLAYHCCALELIFSAISSELWWQIVFSKGGHTYITQITALFLHNRLMLFCEKMELAFHLLEFRRSWEYGRTDSA